MIERIQIENYKSIQKMDLDLRAINILIGANGAGKSNFISCFQLVLAVYEDNIRVFSAKKGTNNLLYRGLKHSKSIIGLLDFDNSNAFAFELVPRNEETLYVTKAVVYWNPSETMDKDYAQKWYRKDINSPQSKFRDGYISTYLSSFRVYHFHDTSETAAMRISCPIDDNMGLREDGGNLAALLYFLQEKHSKHYLEIESTVRSIAPFFERFDLKPRNNNPDQIKIEWKERGSDMYLDGYNLSDGTLRFIALTTLLLQPNPPKTIIIDEPELGLHPVAMQTLAGLMRKAAHFSQIIVSTQSVDLVNQFKPEDIIAVDRKNGQSVFERLDADGLQSWLKEYSLGELWQKNIIGGQP